MGITIKPNHLKLYRDVGYLLMKYGQVDLVKGAGLEEVLWNEEAEGIARTTTPISDFKGDGGNGPQLDATAAGALKKEDELIVDLEKLGPTFIKLGQLLALRSDLLPLPYLEALSHLGRQIEPMPAADIEGIVLAELGIPLVSAFQTFETIPLSSSLFGQVHKAALFDGKPVIVKLQRPGIREEVYDDLEALEEMAQFYDQHIKSLTQFDLHNILLQFRKVILAELDYRQEAHNIRTLKDNLKDLDLIILPTPIESLSSSRMLTMSYIEGQNITEVANFQLLKAERSRLAEQVFYAYLQQILVDGFVDAEPDPTSVLLTRSAKIALLDIGVVVRLTPKMQEKLLQLLLAVCEGRAERVVDLLITIGNKRESFSETNFRRSITELVLIHRDMTADQLQIGKVFLGIAQTSVKCGITLPFELAMLGNALLNLDCIAHLLDAHFDSNSFVHDHVIEITRHHMLKTLSPGHIFQNITEAVELLERLPGKVSKILDAVVNNEIKVTVHAIDENLLMSGFQKIANRITIGLVLAALIVGASMLMRVPTTFTIWGYPGFAMACFIAAAGCGFALVLEILVSDHVAKH